MATGISAEGLTVFRAGSVESNGSCGKAIPPPYGKSRVSRVPGVMQPNCDTREQGLNPTSAKVANTLPEGAIPPSPGGFSNLQWTHFANFLLPTLTFLTLLTLLTLFTLLSLRVFGPGGILRLSRRQRVFSARCGGILPRAAPSPDGSPGIPIRGFPGQEKNNGPPRFPGASGAFILWPEFPPKNEPQPPRGT